ncbi:histone-like nucleoid-structuring protein, MvaT/MvaU family [Pseudomonas japonica]|uniref:histone-like nucleoid-structuring protein, MvaT/MvaU family n=1 Tax=Pseudomonas japonica TaxID=256466 RepID=UPI0015E29283|nr:histone-like nucleoid-structuring protein, MvaT/MvaU family [Pseudomonas japonica]MBA1245873.1 DNA binding protein [Pseudomonas japonica]
MSRLAEFRALEQKLAEQLAELETMKNDEGLKREVEFEEKLRGLLGEYNFSLKHIIAILDPQGSQPSPRAGRGAAKTEEKTTRKARQVKRYKHPESGEVVETKGGNHKTLKAWKAEHGAETVESWLQ